MSTSCIERVAPGRRTRISRRICSRRSCSVCSERATGHDGVSLFHPERPYVIACIGPREARHFYIDVAHRVRVEPQLIEFVDLYLDVMIDATGTVREKDEHQLGELPANLQHYARTARDEVRRLIAAGDPKFDARSRFFAVADEARSLPPARETLEL